MPCFVRLTLRAGTLTPGVAEGHFAHMFKLVAPRSLYASCSYAYSSHFRPPDTASAMHCPQTRA